MSMILKLFLQLFKNLMLQILFIKNSEGAQLLKAV